jgi:hypothetical protein
LTLSFGRRVIALAQARRVAGFSLTIAMSEALVVMSVLDTTLPAAASSMPAARYERASPCTSSWPG